MGIAIKILSVLTFIGVLITILAYIGLKVKKQEKNIKSQLEKHERIQNSKKWSRKSTPKVPTIKS